MKQYTNPGETLAAKWAELGRKAAKHFTSVLLHVFANYTTRS